MDKGLGTQGLSSTGDVSSGHFSRFNLQITSPPDNFTTLTGGNGTMGPGVHGSSTATRSHGRISIPGSSTGLPPVRLLLPIVPTTGIAARSGSLPVTCGGIAEPNTPEPSAPATEVLGKSLRLLWYFE